MKGDNRKKKPCHLCLGRLHHPVEHPPSGNITARYIEDRVAYLLARPLRLDNRYGMDTIPADGNKATGELRPRCTQVKPNLTFGPFKNRFVKSLLLAFGKQKRTERRRLNPN